MTPRSRNRLLVAALYAILIAMGWGVSLLWQHVDTSQLSSMDPTMMIQILTVGLLIFVLTSALPFVPGAEIGLGLMVVFGGKVAALVYAGMVAALTLSYLVGALVPPHWIARFFGFLGFTRARHLVEELCHRERHERIHYLLETAPRAWVPGLLRHRYLAFMLLLNIPGNSLVGGGGGLALAAGMSGFFRFPAFVAAVLVAVAPVPLFFFLTM